MSEREKRGVSVEKRMGQYGMYQVVLYNVDAMVAFAVRKEKESAAKP